MLEELGATEQKRIEVINKCDAADPEPNEIAGAILISAKTGAGLEELKTAIAEAVQGTYAPVTFSIPFSRYGILSEIHALGRVITEEHTAEGTRITAMMSGEDAERLTRKHGADIFAKE